MTGEGSAPIFKRLLLKMSGEALAGEGTKAIDPVIVDRIVTEIQHIYSLGVQVGV